MNFTNKKIGIWGLGIVGKAALKFFSKYTSAITIMDKKELSEIDRALIQKYNGNFIPQTDAAHFFIDNDFIIASPGINTLAYHEYRHKFITELDIIHQAIKKPIIAITGTIGKTSITHILSTCIAHHELVITGGNIGIGMLELIEKQEQYSRIVLEVSSFQLEQCTQFAPQLAIWTNFYPNHLDRHPSIEEYFNAKSKILAYQNELHSALLPLELAPHIQNKNYKAQIHFFCPEKPADEILYTLPATSLVFWPQATTIMCCNQQIIQPIGSLNQQGTFPINWLIIQAALYILEMPQPKDAHIPIPEHRIEKIAEYAGIEFYNDSKSTIMESTIAAVHKLQPKPIILLLGGLSKGADRASKIKELEHTIKYIITFGAESASLQQAAQHYAIPNCAVTTLQEAVHYAYSIAQPGDQILLSPGGSSYDQFSDYKERGNQFKTIIQNIIR